MNDTFKSEMDRAIAVVKCNDARRALYTSKELYCPVCGRKCTALNGISYEKVIEIVSIFCRSCRSEFAVVWHNELIEVTPKKVEQ